MKKNLVKKVASIVIVALVCALVLVTIVLALVPKKLENVIPTGYNSITIYSGDASQTYNVKYDETNPSNSEVASKVLTLHQDSLKDSILSAIFQGVGSFDVNVVNKSVDNALTTAKDESEYVLTFNYGTTQTLKIGGKEYKHKADLSGEYVTFDKIIMPLGSKDSFEECTLYLVQKGSTSSTTYKSKYRVKYLAHHSDLVKYIDSLEFPVQ